MFEPKTLPTAVSVLPPNAAVADTIISGAEEPIAKDGHADNKGDIPMFRANAATPKTSLSALQTRKANPTTRNAIASNMVILNLVAKRIKLTADFDGLTEKRK